MKVVIQKSYIEYKILYFLLLFMPLHYYICELLLSGTSIDNIFRDILILILFSLVFMHKHFRTNIIGILVGFNCGILLSFALISIITHSYPNTLNILRTYLMPCLIFYVSSNINFGKAEFVNLHRLIVIQLAIIGIYGFIQAFFLGDDFLVKIGYPSVNGILNTSSFYIGGFYGFQRVVGSFVSPNVCGSVLVIGLCALMFCRINLNFKHKNIVLGCILIGLLGTFSRSSLIGFAMSLLFIFVLKARLIKININKILPLVLAITGLVILILLVDSYLLGGVFTSMIKSSFLGTITGSDASMLKHISDLFEPLNIVLKHPFGMGFGNNGPMALSYSTNANTVESSLYLMMYEIGILGGIMFFIPFIVVILMTIKNCRFNYYVPACVCISVFITFLLLPNVQTFEVLFYSYFFIGLYFNSSIRTIFYKNKYNEFRGGRCEKHLK